MNSPTDAQLKDRARTMLEHMTERERWIYALAKQGAFDAARGIFADAGVAEVDSDAGGSVRKYATERTEQHFVLFDKKDLDVVLLEARGVAAVPVVKRILDATGFVPQSSLWRTALDVGHPDATKALSVLAHMMVLWDEDWMDLFLLHLASPDAVVRHDTTTALTIAAMVAQDAEPALALLKEAKRREKFPQLSDTMGEALRVLESLPGRATRVDA